MQPDLLRRLAVGACLTMAALVLLLQTVLTPGRAAPPALFALFLFLWLFGAAMLTWAPRFGALGTAAWGVISGVASWRMHPALAGTENAALALLAFAAAALAGGYLVLRWQASRTV